MADTIRETIIASIASTLAAYSFTTLADATVVRGMEYIDLSAYELPLISVLAQADTADPEGGPYGQTSIVMPVHLWALMSFETDSASATGEAVLGEIITASLGTLPTGADSIHYTGGGVQYPGSLDETVLSVSAYFEIQYRTNIGNPYLLT